MAASHHPDERRGQVGSFADVRPNVRRWRQARAPPHPARGAMRRGTRMGGRPPDRPAVGVLWLSPGRPPPVGAPVCVCVHRLGPPAVGGVLGRPAARRRAPLAPAASPLSCHGERHGGRSAPPRRPERFAAAPELRRASTRRPIDRCRATPGDAGRRPAIRVTRAGPGRPDAGRAGRRGGGILARRRRAYTRRTRQARRG